MRAWRRWRQLSGMERGLLIRALARVVQARLVLSVLPFRVVRGMIQPPVQAVRPTESVVQFVWAVRAAARFVPKASCLTQALALKSMLAKAGYDSTLRIGVNPALSGRFSAHAWIERNGEVLIGQEEAGNHSRLAAW